VGTTNKDSDNDTFYDIDDNCPSVANGPAQAGIPGVGNQLDSDGDGIGDACDRCPYDAENDIDGDGVCGNEDNCPTVYNPKVAGLQPDLDGDGIGDACDNDADGDTYISVAYGGNDCNDRDVLVHPGVAEIPRNGRDDDCNPVTHDSEIVFTFTDNANPNDPFAYQKWLPTDGASITVAVSVDGGTLNGLTVLNVTKYAGKYTNDASTDTSYDFRCSATNCAPNMIIAGSQVTLTSLDFGGSITFRAEATVAGNTIAADFTIPKDTDGDGLPDAWENLYGDLAPNEDTDRSPKNNYVGDGLTNFQEYRGLKWGELRKIDPDPATNPYKTTAYVFDNVRHFRTKPLKKDLFVKYRNFGPDGTPDYYNTTDYPFAIGAAFNEAEIDVHAVSETNYTSNGLGSNNIEAVIISLETQKSYGSGSSTADSYAYISRQKDANNKIIPRGWKWATKGYSLPGSGTSYGSPTIYKKALHFYFTNKPYAEGLTWDGTSWLPRNYALDPLNLVEDKNDDGAFNAGEDITGGSAGVLDGDAYKTPVSFNRDLSTFDVDINGDVELPIVSDFKSIDRDFEYKEKHVLKHTITHEMGHAVGVLTSHTADSSCLMYKYSNTWSRDWQFGTTAKGYIQIHK
jgi:hypothetical protein